jgi:hypothetical protein
MAGALGSKDDATFTKQSRHTATGSSQRPERCVAVLNSGGYALRADLEEMQIVINEIVAKDLKDTGTFYDAQDPCVVITVGRSSIETERSELYLDHFLILFS